MANLKIDTTVRNNMMDEIATAAGSGALIRIYSGAQPSGGGTPGGTLLGTLTVAGAFASGASAGVLTINAITSDSAADATGTASWFRAVTSGGTYVFDGDISVTGGNGDMTLDTLSIILNGTIAVTSATLTAPNAI